jgi:uncharacterized protein
MRDNAAVEVALVLTHACNMACSYCYTGEKKRVRMSPAIADRALEASFARATTELQLTFFGGEPLLEADLLCALASQARARAARLGVTLRLQVTTNGTRLDDALLTRLLALDVHIALSIDGNRRAHEAGRAFVGGSSSYDSTRAALTRLLASGRRFDVVMVVDPANVEHLGDGVLELFDLGVESITLNPNWSAAWSDDALSRWRGGYEHAAAITLAWHRRGRAVRLQPLHGAMTALEHGRDIGQTCGAGQHSFAVAPSGNVYACARSVGEDLGHDKICHVDDWLPTAPFTGRNQRAECVGCAAAERCERHCACACREETSDPFTPGPILCWHQSMVEELATRLSRLHAVVCSTQSFERHHE